MAKTKLLFLLTLVISFVGCKDTAQVRSAIGTYSYKSSGTLTVDSLSPVRFTEQGAMEVVSLKNKDSVLITFNELFGEVYATRASIKGKELTFTPFERIIEPSILTQSMWVQVSGKGQVLDDCITLNLEYHNRPLDTTLISATDVLLIAKKNTK